MPEEDFTVEQSKIIKPLTLIVQSPYYKVKVMPQEELIKSFFEIVLELQEIEDD